MLYMIRSSFTQIFIIIIIIMHIKGSEIYSLKKTKTHVFSKTPARGGNKWSQCAD